MTLKLHTIICSTRPGRAGPMIAEWFHAKAAEHGKFEPVLVDLADFDLPLLDEPHHPRLQKYEHDHTKAWSASVHAADAFVFVTPEYNYGSPPSLLNALNYVYKEWNYKPAGFVSYGGVSGGLRSVQMSKQVVTALKMMPMTEGIPIPNYAQFLDEEKNFRPNELVERSVKPMLDELHRWAEALKPMRG
ncbi:NADPH-dependent FMN reductase [Microvirga lenta]|uniref:NADPH-dependent FMN reductase n=1 Tax=Microvirga lenta TaxID=2881337 RepID=UPI001CFFF677|nr:NAD(P)H-dependent oxidoreductase [Microvirga lenta]MCB5175572.1 NAD(P)H-dependent oxidoreductase [Microvirga lenta]